MSVFIPSGGGGGGASDYLEYGWVCAPNTAGQSITANTITTLAIDTEVADAGGHGSIASNQITLAPGTYYFEAEVPIATGEGALTVSLYNITDGAYVRRLASGIAEGLSYGTQPLRFNGQFAIASAKTFELRMWHAAASSVRGASVQSTLSTADADQRTTLKLWKLA